MKFYDAFDEIGQFITSMAIVIILMVPFMWYRFYEFDTLFMKWLPIDNELDRETPATLISLVLICITLLFMVNTGRLFKGIKVLLAATSFTFNMFFWSLKTDGDWRFILFISAVNASMDYGLAHLFYVMWKEKGMAKEMIDIKSDVDVAKQELDEVRTKIARLTPVMKEYEEIYDKCYCKACERTFPSQQAKNAHKCKPKPMYNDTKRIPNG